MRRKNRTIRIESLEGRSLMAGNVLAAIQLGNLKIDGDSQANDIAVVDLGGGKVTVSGQNGTTVNGLASVDLTGFTSNLKIDLKSGDDAVSFLGNESHTIPRFKVETGLGNDSIKLDKLLAGEGEVDSGAGNDTIVLLNAKAAELSLESGLGDDTVRVGNSSTDAAIVSITVSELEIETGAGLDQVQILNANLNSSSLEIASGGGDDKVTVQKITGSSSLRVSTGLGTDIVSVEDATFKSLSIDLGGGDNDSLSIKKVTSDRTKLNGGDGVGDKLIIDALSSLGTLKKSGFEA